MVRWEQSLEGFEYHLIGEGIKTLITSVMLFPVIKSKSRELFEESVCQPRARAFGGGGSVTTRGCDNESDSARRKGRAKASSGRGSEVEGAALLEPNSLWGQGQGQEYSGPQPLDSLGGRQVSLANY